MQSSGSSPRAPINRPTWLALLSPLFAALVVIGAQPLHAQREPATPSNPSTNESTSRSDRTATDATFAARLEVLAEEAAENNLTLLHDQIRTWYIPRHADRQYLFLPPAASPDTRDTPSDDKAGELSEAEQNIRAKWMAARGEQADRLSKLADRALIAGNADATVQLLHEVLRERPHDKKARQALGLNKSAKSGKAARSMKPRVSRTAEHAYGWPAGGYWRMQTEHFILTTNHSPAAAEELATILEEFHTLWEQLFVSYWTTPAAVRQSMSGRGLSRRSGAKHRVVLFKSREEYTDHLKRIEPQAALTLGIYRDKDRTAYFFYGDKQFHSTWRHEVAHQLFYESLRRGQRVGTEHNFWLIEGVALYLESLQRIETCGSDADGLPCKNAYYTVGGFDAERLQFARYRALNEGFYVPSSELSQLGRVALQQDPRIRRLYSQSAGLTHFLLDGADGHYRSATLKLLRDIYNGVDKADSMSSLAATTPTEIDNAYRQFLFVQNEQLAALANGANQTAINKLCLGKSSVTDAGMERLSKLKALTWLDLADCDVSDVGVRYLSPELPLVPELDLSNTQISDAGLVEVAKLKNLRVLWLTSTEVSDAGIRQLAGLKHLETLDVSHTNVTRQAWQRLKEDLPQLNTAAQR